MILKMLLGVVVVTFIIVLMLFLHSQFFAWDIAMFLKERGLYTYFIENKTLIICLAFCLLLCFVFLLIINRFSTYLNQITNAVQKIFCESEDTIHLSKDLIEIETQLNSISHNMKLRALQAHESEQRKNDLVVYLAHDLKTPLASVIGYLNLLKAEPDIPTDIRAKYVGITLERAQRLEELINEFFEITKFNLQNIELTISDVNITILLRQIIEEFYPLFSNKEIQCTNSIDSNLSIKGDNDKIARVIDNLLRNAINYSYSNSIIHINAHSFESNIIINFINHGDVIPEDKIQCIFDRFYRLDSSRSSNTGGSGLGLAIAKEIVKLHNGTISVTSSVECTSFTVTLPIGN